MTLYHSLYGRCPLMHTRTPCIPEGGGVGGGGGDLISNIHVRICVSRSEGNGSVFRHQANEMNENLSFDMDMSLLFPSIWVSIFWICCSQLALCTNMPELNYN